MGASINYGCAVQQCIALSTTEAEVIALTRAVQEVVCMRKVYEDLVGPNEQPTFVFCDNNAAIQLTRNNRHHKRTKHIDLRFFYCREKEEDGTIRSARVPTKLNIADSFTKVMDRLTIKRHRFQLHGMDLRGTGGGGVSKAVFHQIEDPDHVREGEQNESHAMEFDVSSLDGVYDNTNHDYLNGMRIGEAKHPGPILTFAVPTQAQARESPAAACAYYAAVVLPWLDEHPQFHQMGACQTCGKNTGKWCNMCHINDTRPACLDAATRLWTPMCDECQRENRRCHYCGVCGGNSPTDKWMCGNGY